MRRIDKQSCLIGNLSEHSPMLSRVRSTRMTSYPHSLGTSDAVPDDLLALAPNSQRRLPWFGRNDPRTFLRLCSMEHSTYQFRDSVTTRSFVAPTENFRGRSGNAHVFASFRSPDAVVHRLRACQDRLPALSCCPSIRWYPR
jgi:hypothetical protein